jgi:hypothetical protein
MADFDQTQCRQRRDDGCSCRPLRKARCAALRSRARLTISRQSMNGRRCCRAELAAVEAIANEDPGLIELDGLTDRLTAYRFVRKLDMTISDQLKAARAQIAEVRQSAANAVAETADASDLVKQEVGKLLREAAALRAELAGLTNGGPDLEPIGATIIPPVTL